MCHLEFENKAQSVAGKPPRKRRGGNSKATQVKSEDEEPSKQRYIPFGSTSVTRGTATTQENDAMQGTETRFFLGSIC